MAPEAEKFKYYKKFQKNLKKIKFYQKIAQFCDIKKLKNYSLAIKNLPVTFLSQKPLRMFPGPWVWKDLNKYNVKKFEKIARFVKKNAKIRDVN